MMPPDTRGVLLQLRPPGHMSPAVSNAYHVLCDAIRTEILTSKDVTQWGDLTIAQKEKMQHAIGWRLFCRDAFCDLLMHQVEDQITLEYLAEDDPS